MEIKGLNLGAGHWQHPGWLGFDERHIPDLAVLDAGTRFDFADDSIDFVFSAHFFEHVDDATAQNLLNQSFRVLKAGGALRVVVPDFEMTLDRYRSGDHSFFDSEHIWGMAPRFENWIAHGVSPTLENKLLFAFTNYASMADTGLGFPPWRANPRYYCGPPRVDATEIAYAAYRFPALVFSAWAVAQLPPSSQRHDVGHLNAFTLDKFRIMMFRAGFRQVNRSYFRNSAFEELQHSNFDNRPTFSLFVEAVKGACQPG